MISVSFLSSIYDTKNTIDMICNTDADYIHVDMMDGIFVDNKNYSMEEFESFLSGTTKDLDVHVMVSDPMKYISSFAKLNTKYYTFHYEAVDNIEEVINEIKNNGMKAGIAVNPETSVELIKPYLDLVDMVLVMSVNPGKGGQAFISDVLPKIEELSNLKSDFIINVDGGINSETAKLCKNAGVDMLVSGSYICKSDNYQEMINTLK